MSSVGSSNGITGTFGPNVTALFNTTAPDYSQYPPLCVSALALVGQSCYSTTFANTNIFFAPTNLDQLCSNTCSNAVKYFASTMPVCGSLVIEAFSKTTGLLLYSYMEMISNYACIKVNGAYCYPQQVQVLTQNGISLVGPDAFSNVLQFTVNNNTILCSTCFQNQFKSIIGLKDLDPSLYPELQTGAGLIQKNCVATTTTTTSTATKTQTSTTAPSATTQSSARATSKYFAFVFAFLYFALNQ
ncbi:hypothetical protein HK103_000646 [Boothiomyces macroporosus]|uniref:Uncharacterized protein n=1 Tax=Boothiomyces macroporosus TaxID=261099 RepID=A0AAD5YA84_9FUNG|nr:hypothetical protein HK103_000646 [Boothiomyces macroporosus]